MNQTHILVLYFRDGVRDIFLFVNPTQPKVLLILL